MMPKSYRATVSLLVDTRDEQSLGDALRPLVLPQERMSYLQTQVDILTSPKVARAVAQELRLEETPGALAALGMKRGRGERTEDLLVVDNAFVQQLKGELLHGEEKLQELTTQYGVNHPVYRRQISENQTLRTRLQAEMRKLAAGAAAAGVDAAPDDALKAGVPGPQASDEAVLVRNVQSAERAYETAMQRYVVSQVDSRASQTNVEVLNPAVAPLKPYRPNIALNIALSLFTGVVLGGILVALLETQDRRVRSPEDLQSASRVPVLAVIGEGGRRSARLLLSPPGTVLRALPRPQGRRM